MRSLIAVAALVLLVAPGCGDDTTSSAVDMTAVADMSMPVDMAQITSCRALLTCAAGCNMNTTCQQDCINRGSASAVATLLSLNDCLIMQCTMSDGGTPQCSGPKDTSMTCQQCILAAGQAAATGGACSSEFATCFNQ